MSHFNGILAVYEEYIVNYKYGAKSVILLVNSKDMCTLTHEEGDLNGSHLVEERKKGILFILIIN